jgi:hypothetical protein
MRELTPHSVRGPGEDEDLTLVKIADPRLPKMPDPFMVVASS